MTCAPTWAVARGAKWCARASVGPVGRTGTRTSSVTVFAFCPQGKMQARRVRIPTGGFKDRQPAGRLKRLQPDEGLAASSPAELREAQLGGRPRSGTAQEGVGAAPPDTAPPLRR